MSIISTNRLPLLLASILQRSSVAAADQNNVFTHLFYPLGNWETESHPEKYSQI
ncbi:hypothetical protein [Anabaena sp. UHCC 0451]|uniref:hypothetical protein n=1 Tax=Anabaena sp. UHCC 0451 TaxID=2055235 RepID=UPI002B21A204|nr:hypothetical protein [Anabaena sp. UHCC 0451]MEA5575483.1 hypothetical protein [Anabaena sp. UHCC 0451]